MSKLLAAGLAEFSERGFQAVTVDDIVRRASTSHGTFYLYFANKDDFLRALSEDALREMERLADHFPVVTADNGDKAALREWVLTFCDTYSAHATVISALSQADLVGQTAWANGLVTLLHLAEAVVLGMTAGKSTHGSHVNASRARLGAVACLMMLERVNYLLANGVPLPRETMIDQMSSIIFAAFHGDEAPAGPGGFPGEQGGSARKL